MKTKEVKKKRLKWLRLRGVIVKLWMEPRGESTLVILAKLQTPGGFTERLMGVSPGRGMSVKSHRQKAKRLMNRIAREHGYEQ